MGWKSESMESFGGSTAFAGSKHGFDALEAPCLPAQKAALNARKATFCTVIRPWFWVNKSQVIGYQLNMKTLITRLFAAEKLFARKNVSIHGVVVK